MSDDRDKNKRSGNMPGSMEAEYFRDEKVQLSKELHYHPELLGLLDQYSMDDIGGRLGEIAAYVDVILDGDYYEEELVKLCGILAKKLYMKRSPIIIH